MGYSAVTRKARRESVRKFKKMAEIAQKMGAKEFVQMRATLNGMRFRERLWQAIKLLCGRL